MDYATGCRLLLATHFATSLFPLTVRLIAEITEIGRLIVRFRRAELNPQAGHQFETQLHAHLRELGRIIVEWTFNHLEPRDRTDMPKEIDFPGTRYRRRSKTPNRSLATVFGTITLCRWLYQDVQEIEPAIFPLELRLGLEAGLATPALAERAAQAAAHSPQAAVLDRLKDDHGVCWSVASLRKVLAGVAAGVAAHRHDAQVAQLLQWLEQADQSTGNRKVVLAVGRDGLMLPIRGQACYREGATATVSVHDRRGRRLGTVVLGRMPEPGQGTLPGQLTAVITAVLAAWTGPRPRLAYITDGGHHQTQYYRRVLRRMRDPHHPARRLKWAWVIDYYHVCEYIFNMAEALFREARQAQAWARKMGRWLKEKPRGISRVLHSAAALRRRRIIVSAAKQKQYRDAYAYLHKRIRWLDYLSHRRDHLPIGSGVTEAACKTVFTQRMKQSGMTWHVETGQWILDLRVVQLSGVWTEVYQSYLRSKAFPPMGTQACTVQEEAPDAA
jgi:hypothetical protein